MALQDQYTCLSVQLSLFALDKRCTRCGIVKPVDQFAYYAKSIDSRQYWCRSCFRAHGGQTERRRATIAVGLGQKQCLKCLAVLPLSAFGRDSRRADGHFPYCKRCRLKDAVKRDQEQAQRAAGLRWCTRCKQWLTPSCFGANRFYPDGIHRQCRPCTLADALRYYREDPERSRLRNKRRYWAYKEQFLAKWRAWYALNREEVQARALARSRTPEGRAYQARANHLRRLRTALVPATLTAAEWQQILGRQNHRCLLCQRAFSTALPPTRDHLIPVSKGGGLTLRNTVALCKPCNSGKRDRIMPGLLALVQQWDD